MRSKAGFLLLLTIVAAAGGACLNRPVGSTLSLDAPTTTDGDAPFLLAHMRDGRAVEFDTWRVGESGAIRGTGRILDPNRREIHRGDLTIPLESVALFETNALELSPSIAALSVMMGITAGVTAACIANPKTCFGSCPTFYLPDLPGRHPRAEGFSASIAPSLEATDVDALPELRLAGPTLAVSMRNEALETHVVRRVRLRSALRPSGGRVLATGEGAYREVLEIQPPVACHAPEGDCLDLLREVDRRERYSSADSTDLAARESIELVFEDPPEGALGLVLVSRQTLLSTFLLYQALAWMGRDAPRRLASLERGGRGAVRAAGGIGRRLGGIEVALLVDDEWIVAGEPNETGPLASDAKVIALPRPRPGEPARVRLRATRGHWRIDQAALARLGSSVTTTAVDPARVLRGGLADEGARNRLIDPEDALVTRPGDAYTLIFPLPEDPERFEYFLESRGYYLEWMRAEWIEEQDPVRAARLFLDPAGILRELASEYARLEPAMERMFWDSRYVAPR